MSEILWIQKSTYTQMCSLGDQSFPLETGGMLLGYIADNGDVVVTSIIGPGPDAIHNRYGFSPDAEYQQMELTSHYLHTNGQETYLGDWHTHPLGSTTLSRLDKRTLARISRTPSSGIPKPIMGILCGGNSDWAIGVVRLHGYSRRLIFNQYDLRPLTLHFYS